MVHHLRLRSIDILYAVTWNRSRRQRGLPMLTTMKTPIHIAIAPMSTTMTTTITTTTTGALHTFCTVRTRNQFWALKLQVDLDWVYQDMMILSTPDQKIWWKEWRRLSEARLLSMGMQPWRASSSKKQRTTARSLCQILTKARRKSAKTWRGNT